MQPPKGQVCCRVACCLLAGSNTNRCQLTASFQLHWRLHSQWLVPKKPCMMRKLQAPLLALCSLTHRPHRRTSAKRVATVFVFSFLRMEEERTKEESKGRIRGYAWEGGGADEWARQRLQVGCVPTPAPPGCLSPCWHGSRGELLPRFDRLALSARRLLPAGAIMTRLQGARHSPGTPLAQLALSGGGAGGIQGVGVCRRGPSREATWLAVRFKFYSGQSPRQRTAYGRTGATVLFVCLSTTKRQQGFLPWACSLNDRREACSENTSPWCNTHQAESRSPPGSGECKWSRQLQATSIPWHAEEKLGLSCCTQQLQCGAKRTWRAAAALITPQPVSLLPFTEASTGRPCRDCCAQADSPPGMLMPPFRSDVPTLLPNTPAERPGGQSNSHQWPWHAQSKLLRVWRDTSGERGCKASLRRLWESPRRDAGVERELVGAESWAAGGCGGSPKMALVGSAAMRDTTARAVSFTASKMSV